MMIPKKISKQQQKHEELVEAVKFGSVLMGALAVAIISFWVIVLILG